MSDKTDPFENVPLHARERVRLATTRLNLVSKRTTGLVKSDDEIIKDNQYASVDEFWRAELSKPMTALSYVQFLRQGHLSPSMADMPMLALSVASQLKLACRAGLPWIFRDALSAGSSSDTLEGSIVDPRLATEWLLSLPTERALVPDDLRDFLEGRQSEAPFDGLWAHQKHGGWTTGAPGANQRGHSTAR
jgi:hypothetical protein